MGLFEFADVPPGRAGEGSLFVPKQLRFDQLGRHGGAVERDKRPAPARAPVVGGTGDEFLARAGLAQNAYAGFARRHPLDLRHKPLHHRAHPDHFVLAQPLAQFPVFFFQTRQAQGVLHSDKQLFGRERLLEKIDGPKPRCAYGHLHGGLSGDHHHRGCHPRHFEIFEQREAVLAGHDHVGKDDVEALRFDQLERADGAVANCGFMAGQAKRASQRRQGVGIVVDHQ